MGVAPTGKEVTFSGLILNRLAGGKIVAWWGHWDAVGLLQQLGAIPAQAPAQA